jgi:type II secretory pathway pseudopilin PulG
MRAHRRTGFTFLPLLTVVALLGFLCSLLVPAAVKVRRAAARAESTNNLKQLGIACHNYLDSNNGFPPGIDAKGFSAAAYLLPYVEQDQLFKKIDLTKPPDDMANADVRMVVVKLFLSPLDPRKSVDDYQGATNYLFSAGSKFDLKDNDGIFFQESAIRINDIPDGTSNTLMIGETLKGDGDVKGKDVRRQYVRFKDKAALANLTDESGVKEFRDGQNIAADRCASWMDGRFLQGTFAGNRRLNDERPDVSCDGAGGLSALRTLHEVVHVAFCDGSVRSLTTKLDLEVLKAMATRNGGEVIPADF